MKNKVDMEQLLSLGIRESYTLLTINNEQYSLENIYRLLKSNLKKI